MAKPAKRPFACLVLGLALGLAACGGSEESDSDNAITTTTNTALIAEETTANVAPPMVTSVATKRYALAEAAQRGLVGYEVAGRDGSSGPALTLKIRRLVAEPIEIYVPPGTVFKTGSAGVQTMVARSILGEIAKDITQELIQTALEESGVVELIDDAVHNFLVEAYCRDFELENPSPQDAFTVAHVDPRARALFAAARDRGLGIDAIQAAIWMDRGVTPDRISKMYPATPEDFEAASLLLAGLSPTPSTAGTGNTM